MDATLIKTISCFIIDDEEPAHDVLKFFIDKISWLSYAGSCYNAVEALEMIPEIKPDVLFLDVNMPELSGLDLLNIIQMPVTHVIMTTAYPEYAIHGFTFDVTSFLLKPIGFDRFLKAVTKVRRLIRLSSEGNERAKISLGLEPVDANVILSDHTEWAKEVGPLSSEARLERAAQEEYMWLRADRKMYCIKFKDIYFIEGLKDYVKVYYINGVLITLVSMSSLMNRLPDPTFVRTHRSYIVNRDNIKMIEGNIITMANDIKVLIAVSPTRDEVFRRLTEK